LKPLDRAFIMPIAMARLLSPLHEGHSVKRQRTGNTSANCILAEPSNNLADWTEAVKVASERAHEMKLVDEEMSKPVEFSREYEVEVEYRDQLVLAPMVRTGTCK
jgi:hypothetical protein